MIDHSAYKKEAVPYSAEIVRAGITQLSRVQDPVFCQKITYVNGLTIPVTIVQRDGILKQIPVSWSRENQDFIIRVENYIPDAVIFDVTHILNTVDANYSELRVIHDEELNARSNRSFNAKHTNYTIDYIVTRDMLDRRGGSMYLQERDLVISLNTGEDVPFHPYSKIGAQNQAVNNSEHINNPYNFGLSMYIVDSGSIYGDRFINFQNKIYRVPARKDNRLPDGIYIASTASVKCSVSPFQPPDVNYYTFKDAEKALRLYRSPEEALHFGDEIKEREAEMERLKIHLKEAELISKKKQMEIDEDKAELEQLRKREEHYRSMEKLRRNDDYDRNNHNRKESLELLKYVPAVIAAIGAVWLLYKKTASESQ